MQEYFFLFLKKKETDIYFLFFILRKEETDIFNNEITMITVG
jgi:hypothetical protein